MGSPVVPMQPMPMMAMSGGMGMPVMPNSFGVPMFGVMPMQPGQPLTHSQSASQLQVLQQQQQQLQKQQQLVSSGRGYYVGHIKNVLLKCFNI